MSGRTAVAAGTIEEVARFVEKTGDCPYCPIHQEAQEEASTAQATWTDTNAALPVVGRK